MYERKEKRKDHVYLTYQIWNRILGMGMIGDISDGIRLARWHVFQVSIRSFMQSSNNPLLNKETHVENLF